MKLKQSYYEQGEKASKVLAWRIQQMESERAIIRYKQMKVC